MGKWLTGVRKWFGFSLDYSVKSTSDSFDADATHPLDCEFVCSMNAAAISECEI